MSKYVFFYHANKKCPVKFEAVNAHVDQRVEAFLAKDVGHI